MNEFCILLSLILIISDQTDEKDPPPYIVNMMILSILIDYSVILYRCAEAWPYLLIDFLNTSAGRIQSE